MSNLARFKAPDNFAEIASSKAELRGPRGAEDVRVSETWREPDLLFVRHGGKYYLVDENLSSILTGHVFMAGLRAAISSETGLFIWPVRDGDGKDEKVLQEAAETAVKQWTNVKWDSDHKEYKVEKATTKRPDPEWSDEKINAALDVAIAGRVLDDPESEVVKTILAKKKRGKK